MKKNSKLITNISFLLLPILVVGLCSLLVFTKTDKQNQRETAANVTAFKKALSEEWEELPFMLLTSSATGYGRDKVLDHIDSINLSLKNGTEPSIDS